MRQDFRQLGRLAQRRRLRKIRARTHPPDHLGSQSPSPRNPVIAFPREAGDAYVGFHKATGADCVALDNSVSPDWAAANVQVDGCVQGNLASRHMVTGGQPLIDETRAIVKAFKNGPHIFNLGHGITPDADPENVQLMIDTVRGG
ncbi:hypothetical protein N4R57_00905 [Rhodobacteraceae bacterium D3-12]|nr:hypothetical protein N4R57_00905 [Rhodobacteraceae bacterium D3-12]